MEKTEEVVIQRLVHWAESEDKIRAMLLFSSRANPNSAIDHFSDYDILLAVTDVHYFHADDRWLEDFGKVLVVFRNPVGVEEGFERFGFITHYEDGVKIDYCFYPVEYLAWAAAADRLPDDLDDGYEVLLDKDGCTRSLKPPTYTAYLPFRPSEQEYLAVVETFFNDSIYVAKHLWRDNLFLMKHIMDDELKFIGLRKMLDWRMAAVHNWQLKTSAYGKGLKKQIEPEIWAELESTYAGAGIEENWDALYRTMDLFRKIAVDVASAMCFQYPDAQEKKVLAYIQKIRLA